MGAGHEGESALPPSLRLLWPEAEAESPDQPLDNETAVIAERRAKVFRLYTRGMSIRAIAEHETVRCSKSAVGRDVQHVMESWRQIVKQDAAAHVARELARIAVMETEAYEAWERSKGEITETVTGRRDGGQGGGKGQASASVKKKQRDGNPALFALVLKCWDRRCRLLGVLKTDDLKDKDALPPVKLVAGMDPAELV